MTSHAPQETDELARARLAYISAGQRPLSGPRRAVGQGDDIHAPVRMGAVGKARTAGAAPPAPSPVDAQEPVPLPHTDALEAELDRLAGAWGHRLPAGAGPAWSPTRQSPGPDPVMPVRPAPGQLHRMGTVRRDAQILGPQDGDGAGIAGGQPPGTAHPGAPSGPVMPGPTGPGQDGWAATALAFAQQHVMTLGLLLLCGVLITVMVLTRSEASDLAVGGVEVSAAESSPVITPAPEPAETTPVSVRVHVLGAVRTPGVVSVPSDAIVQDALQAAGGLTPDADPAQLNLAARVADGQQIVVGTKQEPRGEVHDPTGAPSAPGNNGTGTGDGLVNLNTATAAQLEELPGVGPVLASSIIAWREEHGPFRAVAELQEVSGIGPKVFAKLEPLVTV